MVNTRSRIMMRSKRRYVLTPMFFSFEVRGLVAGRNRHGRPASDRTELLKQGVPRAGRLPVGFSASRHSRRFIVLNRKQLLVSESRDLTWRCDRPLPESSGPLRRRFYLLR